MKISKVNHTRDAVSRKESATGGILYRTPGGEREELEKRVLDLTGKAAKLYKVFGDQKFPYVDKNAGNAREAKQCACLYAKKANEAFSKLVSMSRDGIQAEEIADKMISCGIRNSVQTQAPTAEKIGSSFEEEIDKLVNFNLRKSLCKKKNIGNKELDAAKIVKEILKGEKVLEEERTFFAELLREDVRKEKQSAQIVDSIEKQAVPVKPVERNGKYYLALSGIDHPKKHWIFDFLVSFAGGSKQEQEDLLIWMRRLILLYLGGPEAYKISEDNGIGAWTYGKSLPEKSELFVPGAEVLLSELAELGGADKARIKEIEIELGERIAKAIAQHYRDAAALFDSAEEQENRFWLGWIEEKVSSLLGNGSFDSRRRSFRRYSRYLANRLWEEWLSFISEKFIDLGKGVYHFARPYDRTEGRVDFAELPREYQNGITSFDYEKVKAAESVNRDLAAFAAFAVNNFARNLCDEEKIKEIIKEKINSGVEDILLYIDEAAFQKYCKKEEAPMEILQFFGGRSQWEETPEVVCASEYELFEQMRRALSFARNMTFHYTASEKNSRKTSENEIAKAMFLQEKENAGRFVRKKYYSNNVLMFYSDEVITGVMDFLYDRPKMRPAQIPAYNRLFNKAKMKETLERFVRGKSLQKVIGKDTDIAQKYTATMMFLLKEIYYYGFLPSENSRQLFMKAVNEQMEKTTEAYKSSGSKEDKKKEAAHKDFLKRIQEFGNVSLGELCQQIMTDFEQQNNRGHKAKADHTEDKYKHFRTLLYNGLAEAFMEYLLKDEQAKDVLDGLRSPEIKAEMKSAEDFAEGWRAHHYDDLAEAIGEDEALCSWYITAHFLSPKQINHLIGSLKNFIKFNDGIQKRARSTGYNGYEKNEDGFYQALARIFDLVLLSGGQISAHLDDYFANEDAYANFLNRYVAFEAKEIENRIALQAFCDAKVKGGPQGRIGIYHNGTNPVLNRNVIQAKLYGNVAGVAKAERITEKDIRKFYADKANLEEVLKFGKCRYPEEQKALKEFQEEKNRIELLDMMKYTEIVTDLYAQLINWACMRERDDLFFRLGFGYLATVYNDGAAYAPYRKIEGPNVKMEDGALLYQFCAVFDRSLPLYGRDGSVLVEAGKKETSVRIGSFWKEYCYRDAEIVDGGRSLFQNMKPEEEKKTNDLRNYIDHFKYYVNESKSMLDLYGDVYSRFFEYSRKLQKSVTFVFQNVLEGYFVRAGLELKAVEDENGKRKTVIAIKELKTENMTYKGLEYNPKKIMGLDSKVSKEDERKYMNAYKLKGDVYQLPALSDRFLGEIRMILEYHG